MNLNAEVLDALTSINVPDEKARAVAKVFADVAAESAVDKLDDRITSLDVRMRRIESKIEYVMWMVGAGLALTLGGLILRH